MKAKIIWIVAVLFLFSLCAGILLFSAFGGLGFLLPFQKPVIKYGEFPCRLTYELNGEIKVIEDTIICAYDGFTAGTEAGKFCKWKSWLKSGNEELLLLDLK